MSIVPSSGADNVCDRIPLGVLPASVLLTGFGFAVGGLFQALNKLEERSRIILFCSSEFAALGVLAIVVLGSREMGVVRFVSLINWPIWGVLFVGGCFIVFLDLNRTDGVEEEDRKWVSACVFLVTKSELRC